MKKNIIKNKLTVKPFLFVLILSLVSLGSCSEISMKGSSTRSDLQKEKEAEKKIQGGKFISRKLISELEPFKLLDILFVVDSSTSMSPYQKALSEQLNSLLSYFNDKKGDWRIAVTSSTPSQITASNIQHKSCVQMLDGTPNIITSQDYAKDPTATTKRFKDLINIGTDDIQGGRNNSGYEEGLFKILEALNLVNIDTYNEVRKNNPSYEIDTSIFSRETPCPKWYRDDASLVIIILSDEDQCSLNIENGTTGSCVRINEQGNSQTNNLAFLIRDNIPTKDMFNCLSNNKYEFFENETNPQTCINLTGKDLNNIPLDTGSTSSNMWEKYTKVVPAEDRCIFYHNREKLYLAKTNCPAYTTQNVPVDFTKQPNSSSLIPSSASLGMVTRSDSVRIFIDYFNVLKAKKQKYNQNIKMYGILRSDTSEEKPKRYYIDTAYVYKKILTTLNGSNYIPHDIKAINIDNAYSTMMESISKDISSSVLQPTYLKDLPDNVSSVSLGIMKNNQFESLRELVLGKEFEVVGGHIIFKVKITEKEYTHIRINYQVYEY